MNQISLASLMMYLNMNKTKEVDESMVRHMILNSIRMYRTNFKQEFGEVVLAWDSKHYSKNLYHLLYLFCDQPYIVESNLFSKNV